MQQPQPHLAPLKTICVAWPVLTCHRSNTIPLLPLYINCNFIILLYFSVKRIEPSYQNVCHSISHSVSEICYDCCSNVVIKLWKGDVVRGLRVSLRGYGNVLFACCLGEPGPVSGREDV